MQCPEGGAVLREALLRPAETEGDISSHPEHSTHPFGGAVPIPTGGSAAGAQKIPQCQRYVWDPSPSLLVGIHNRKVHFRMFCLGFCLSCKPGLVYEQMNTFINLI